ncbi:MAG TPA: rhodanese-like domain-containing protein [Candidatus Bathyarchaeia archaeon]|nr:rhodanese-like domain-containing protein [Candidatus Bathyarchaeia archaeon]
MEKIIIFYKYIFIEYPKRILKWQTKVCQDLHLTGRIILAHEGINGTLAGTETALAHYKTLMEKHSLFAAIDFKESVGNANHFPRLRIKIKPEIVNLGQCTEKISATNGGTHLSPTQAHALIAQKNDTVVIFDARNACESAIGRFDGAITPDIAHFRDLPAYIDTHLDLFKDKEVLMYCTAGIRCERASAYLNTKNVAKKVYQLTGGIQRYTQQFPHGFFRGKNYVFDGRVVMPVTADIMATCAICSAPCDDYTNCLHASCNKHFIGCISCLQHLKNCCSTHCYTMIYHHNAPQRPPLHKNSYTVLP